jgi:hypothetical protein
MIEEYFADIRLLVQNVRLLQPPDVKYDRRD